MANARHVKADGAKISKAMYEMVDAYEKVAGRVLFDDTPLSTEEAQELCKEVMRARKNRKVIEE